jgi:hypothetical protein
LLLLRCPGENCASLGTASRLKEKVLPVCQERFGCHFPGCRIKFPLYLFLLLFGKTIEQVASSVNTSVALLKDIYETNVLKFFGGLRFFGIPPFRFYPLADGIKRILSGISLDPPQQTPPSLQMDLLLGW